MPLYVKDEEMILFYLPTSQIPIPDILFTDQCMRYDPENIHAFGFRKGVVITTKGFCFEKDTIISLNYKAQVAQTKDFLNAYKQTAIDHGALRKEITDKLITCIRNCPIVARGIKSKILS